MCEDFEVRVSCKRCYAFWILKESEFIETEGSNFCPQCGEELSVED